MPSYKEKKQKLKELVKKEEEERIEKIKKQKYSYVDTDAFKRSEKLYKSYTHVETDFSSLLDLQQLAVAEIGGKKVYKIHEPDGAYLVKHFCDEQEQMQIGYEALNRYIYRPYRTNLDGTNGLYEKEEDSKKNMEENQSISPEEVKNEKGETLYYFNEKIRMANLGYQYDWPKRSYPSTKVPIPETILTLTRKGLKIFNEIKGGEECHYSGEAVIVNYYKEKDYMTGHLDDGEIDQKNPIFSYCFGLSCVFLLGYPERDKEPLAIKLEAGDLLIMSGFSRICYHGVPRVIADSYQPPNAETLGSIELREPSDCEGLKLINERNEIINYFKSHRLNINIRQVYPNVLD